MNKSFRRASALAVLAGSAMLIAGEASASIGQAAGMLPGSSDVVVAINLKASENAESLLSYVPRADLEATALEELGKEGLDKPYENALEAAGRMAFTGGTTSSRTDFMAIGVNINPNDPSAEPVAKVVTLGEYPADAAASLAPLGAKAGETAGTITFPVQEGSTTTIIAASPSPGVMVFSEDAAWSTGVMKTVEDKSNLTAEGNSFNAVSAALTSAPDALVYIPGNFLRTSLGTQPQVQMMAAPLLKADGLMLALMPGTVPTVSLNGAFPTEADATIAKQWAESMIQMGKGQMMQMGAQIADPEQKAQFDKQLAMLSAITVTATGQTMALKLPLTDLPPKEEVRAMILEQLKSSISGSALPMGAAPVEPTIEVTPAAEPGM